MNRAERRHPSQYETLQEVRSRTGISLQTLRKKIYSGELTAYRISDVPGGSFRVRSEDVDEKLMKPVVPQRD